MERISTTKGEFGPSEEEPVRGVIFSQSSAACIVSTPFRLHCASTGIFSRKKGPENRPFHVNLL
jgi:hypothetical protein